MNPKKMKNILYAKRAWIYDPYPGDRAEIKNPNMIISKYFPKYIQDIDITQSNGLTLNKLKRVKILHRVHSYSSTEKMILQSRIYLANKTKTVQQVYRHTSPEQLLQEIRLFPSIRAISLDQSSIILDESHKSSEVLKKEASSLCRVAKFIQGMSKLESLEISFEKQLLRVLGVLNSSKKLKDLKSLKLTIRWRNSAEQKDLVHLFKMKNLLNYVTYLRMNMLAPDGFEAFKEFSKKCLNLRQISLGIGNSDYYWDPNLRTTRFDEPYQVTSNYLESIEAFQKLEMIHIQVEDQLTFIRDFVLPISIKNVVIYFPTCSWDSYEDFGENPVFIKFFERWGKVSNLESLEISDNSNVFDGQFADFSHEVLKRVPQLKKLGLSAYKIGNLFSVPGADPEAFDIVSFFKPLEQINKGLEILEIETHDNLFLREISENELCFPNLSSLKIKGNLFNEINLENYLKLFESSSDSKNKGCTIELEEQNAIISGAVISLLEQIRKAHGRGENLNIILRVSVEGMYGNKGLDALVEELQRLEKEAKEMKNISLYLYAGLD